MGERVRLMGALREQCLHGPGNVSFEVSDWESHLCRQSVNCSSHSLIIQIICFCTASLTQTGYYYSGSGAESRSRASVLTIRSAGAVGVYMRLCSCVCVCVSYRPDGRCMNIFKHLSHGKLHPLTSRGVTDIEFLEISSVSNYVQKPTETRPTQRIQAK